MCEDSFNFPLLILFVWGWVCLPNELANSHDFWTVFLLPCLLDHLQFTLSLFLSFVCNRTSPVWVNFLSLHWAISELDLNISNVCIWKAAYSSARSHGPCEGIKWKSPMPKLDSRIQFFPAPCLPSSLSSFDSTTLSSHIFFNGKMWLNRNQITRMESQVSHLHPGVYLCMCVLSTCFVWGNLHLIHTVILQDRY